MANYRPKLDGGNYEWVALSLRDYHRYANNFWTPPLSDSALELRRVLFHNR